VRFRFDRVTVSGALLTLCLMTLMSWSLKWAATWPTRVVYVTDRAARVNYEASIGFAELALEIIALIVIWTSYQKRMRWSWFVMVVFVSVYFLPVHLLDVLLDVKRVGWQWWPAVVRDAREGRPFAVGALEVIAISTLMVIALLVPVADFFGKKRHLHPGGQSLRSECRSHS
jgi:hypothetical protein